MKRILLTAAVAAMALGAFAAPASADACLTTTVTVNGTPAPTNGTNCVDTP